MSKEVLVVGSKLKAYVKSKGLHSSGDLIEGVNDALYVLVDAAARRCQANKRSTVRKDDV